LDCLKTVGKNRQFAQMFRASNCEATSSYFLIDFRMAPTPLTPPNQRDDPPKDGFDAAEIARANLSYDPPPGRAWRKIARWGGCLILSVAAIWLARRLFL
jgi:hypothetical protein